MNFTPTQLELLFTAKIIAPEGRGMVIADDAYPDAHDLAERGWLEMRFDCEGECIWYWTVQADTALSLADLMTTASASVN